MIERLFKQIRLWIDFWKTKEEIETFMEEMPTLLLIRKYFWENEIIGDLYLHGMFLCHTLENPYLDNQINISSIPIGKYYVKRHDSTKFGNTFKVFELKETYFVEVDGRSEILFHSGNTHKDTKGCILLGKKIGALGKDTAILQSRDAFKEFMHAMENIDLCSFTIKNDTSSMTSKNG